MDKASALAFLAQHSPMPDDGQVTQEEIDTYDSIRCHFMASPDAACIRPLLQSFGRWGGLGVYQLVLGVFRHFTKDELRGPLLEALRSPHESIRYWACQVAQEHPLPEARSALVMLLADPHGDIRLTAASALAFLGDRTCLPAIREAASRATSDDEREMFAEIVEQLSE